MHHSPLHVVTSGYPMVVINGCIAIYVHEIMLCSQLTIEVGCLNVDIGIVGKTVGGALYYGKHLSTNLVQSLLQLIQNVLLQLVYLLKERCTVLNLCLWDTLLNLCYLLTQGSSLLCYLLTYFRNTGTQLIITEGLYPWIYVQYGLHHGTVGLQVARLLVAEKFN